MCTSCTNSHHPSTYVYVLYSPVTTHPPVCTSCTGESPPTHLCVHLVLTIHHHPLVCTSCTNQSPPTHLCVHLGLTVTTHPPVCTSCTNQSPPTHLCIRLVFTSHHPPTCVYVLYSINFSVPRWSRPIWGSARTTVCHKHKQPVYHHPAGWDSESNVWSLHINFIIHVFQPYHAVFFWLPNQAGHGKVDRDKVINHLS